MEAVKLVVGVIVLLSILGFMVIEGHLVLEIIKTLF